MSAADAGATALNHILRLSEMEISGKRLVIRTDMNVPLAGGKISDDERIRACLPTLEFALRNNAAIILLSHFGRPEEGKISDEYSLTPVAKRLSELLKRKVNFSCHYLDGIETVPGEPVLCENVRFNVGEKANDKALAQRYAALGDIFVMDAFATAHRRHASTYGAIRCAGTACAGLLLERELAALSQALENPKRPVVAIVGGAKISSKMSALEHLIDQVDCLILGGGIANTFLAADNHPMEKSLYEPDLIQQTKQLMERARQQRVHIILPEDVVCATEPTDNAKTKIRHIDAIGTDEMILDFGPISSLRVAQAIKEAGTVLWSGPIGVFEKSPFANGTQYLADAVAGSDAYTIAGGGDTVAAINHFGIKSSISYISTGGSAFLKSLEGNKLPAVEALEATI